MIDFIPHSKTIKGKGDTILNLNFIANFEDKNNVLLNTSFGLPISAGIQKQSEKPFASLKKENFAIMVVCTPQEETTMLDIQITIIEYGLKGFYALNCLRTGMLGKRNIFELSRPLAGQVGTNVLSSGKIILNASHPVTSSIY